MTIEIKLCVQCGETLNPATKYDMCFFCFTKTTRPDYTKPGIAQAMADQCDNMNECPYTDRKCYNCMCYKSINTGGKEYCKCGYYKIV